MKKISLILFTLCSLLFVGCQDQSVEPINYQGLSLEDIKNQDIALNKEQLLHHLNNLDNGTTLDATNSNSIEEYVAKVMINETVSQYGELINNNDRISAIKWKRLVCYWVGVAKDNSLLRSLSAKSLNFDNCSLSSITLFCKADDKRPNCLDSTNILSDASAELA